MTAAQWAHRDSASADERGDVWFVFGALDPEARARSIAAKHAVRETIGASEVLALLSAEIRRQRRNHAGT